MLLSNIFFSWNVWFKGSYTFRPINFHFFLMTAPALSNDQTLPTLYVQAFLAKNYLTTDQKNKYTDFHYFHNL